MQEGHLLFCDLVHQLVDLIQQEQPPLSVLGPGNTGVDAASDLVYIVSNMMYFRPQLLDLLRGAGLYGISLNDSDEIGPFAEATPFGLAGEQLVLRWGQFNVQVVLFYWPGYNITSNFIFSYDKSRCDRSGFCFVNICF